MNDCASESFSSQETTCNPVVNRVSEYVPADNGSSTDQISGINSLSTNYHFCSSFSPKAYKSLPLSAASAANAVWQFTESDFLCDNCSCDDPVESFPNGQLRGHDFLPLQRHIVDDKTRESNVVESVVAPMCLATLVCIVLYSVAINAKDDSRCIGQNLISVMPYISNYF